MLVFPVVRTFWKQVDVLKCDAYEIGILGYWLVSKVTSVLFEDIVSVQVDLLGIV